MPFRHSYDVIIKWGDCDPAGIVFYPQFFAMFDEATGFLFQAASGMTRTTLIRHYRDCRMADGRCTRLVQEPRQLRRQSYDRYRGPLPGTIKHTARPPPSS